MEFFMLDTHKEKVKRNILLILVSWISKHFRRPDSTRRKKKAFQNKLSIISSNPSSTTSRTLHRNHKAETFLYEPPAHNTRSIIQGMTFKMNKRSNSATLKSCEREKNAMRWGLKHKLKDKRKANGIPTNILMSNGKDCLIMKRSTGTGWIQPVWYF